MIATASNLKPAMNRTESAYVAHLELRRRAGEIARYWFQGITFKLGPDCRYTPDVLVMLNNGELECHEVKGFWRDDARVKIRVAAGMFPHRFFAVTKSKAGWEYEEFKP